VQSIAIVAVLLELRFSYYIMLAAVLLTVISGIEYLFRIRKLTGNKIVNMPNLITLARFLLIIPFVYYFLKSKIYAAIIIFAIITLSDKLDGISARLMNQKTKLGSAFDSFTDWIFSSSSLVAGVYAGYINVKLGILFLFPIIISAIIKFYYAKKFKGILTSAVSKITVGMAYIAIFAMLINFPYKDILVYLTLFMSVLTALTFAFKAKLNS